MGLAENPIVRLEACGIQRIRISAANSAEGLFKDTALLYPNERSKQDSGENSVSSTQALVAHGTDSVALKAAG